MRLFSLLLLSISSVFAVPYTVSSSGTFSGSNETWSFSFLVDSNPVPVQILPASAGFVVPISGFEFRTNGSVISSSFNRIAFYPPSGQNGFRGGFSSPSTGSSVSLFINFISPTMFSGSIAAPTILPGTYTASDNPIAGNAWIRTPNAQPRSIVGAQATIGAAIPEPGSVGLSLLGLVGLGLLRRRTRG